MHIFKRSIYIYICCRKGIWSPRGGDMVPQTLLAAEPGFLARGIVGKTTCANGGVLRDRIPPGPGTKIPSSAVFPENGLENSHRKKHETTIFIVVSCFLGPFFGEAPKTAKSHLADGATTRLFFLGGFFLYKVPFLVSV